MLQTDNILLDLAYKYWPDLIRSYKKGKILYLQGDPVDFLFVINKGTVKIPSVSY